MEGLARFARHLVSSLLVTWLVSLPRHVLPKSQRP